ncbi:MAG: preprotein translocase subunit SecG [Kiritimatiellia bacterium]
MTFLKILLVTIEVLCSLLLIGVVLLQKGKSEGLGMAFGAEMGESLFGARAANVLTKITIWLGIIFVLNTIALAKIYSSSDGASVLQRVGAPVPVEQSAAPAPVPMTADE